MALRRWPVSRVLAERKRYCRWALDQCLCVTGQEVWWNAGSTRKTQLDEEGDKLIEVESKMKSNEARRRGLALRPGALATAQVFTSRQDSQLSRLPRRMLQAFSHRIILAHCELDVGEGGPKDRVLLILELIFHGHLQRQPCIQNSQTMQTPHYKEEPSTLNLRLGLTVDGFKSLRYHCTMSEVHRCFHSNVQWTKAIPNLLRTIPLQPKVIPHLSRMI